jgi:hypothetical protein
VTAVRDFWAARDEVPVVPVMECGGICDLQVRHLTEKGLISSLSAHLQAQAPEDDTAAGIFGTDQ